MPQYWTFVMTSFAYTICGTCSRKSRICITFFKLLFIDALQQSIKTLFGNFTAQNRYCWRIFLIFSFTLLYSWNVPNIWQAMTAVIVYITLACIYNTSSTDITAYQLILFKSVKYCYKNSFSNLVQIVFMTLWEVSHYICIFSTQYFVFCDDQHVSHIHEFRHTKFSVPLILLILV